MLRLAIVMCSLIVSSAMFNAEAAEISCKTSTRHGVVSWTCPADKECCYDFQADKPLCNAPGVCCKVCDGEGICHCID